MLISFLIILAIKHSPSKKKPRGDGRRGTVGSEGKEQKKSGGAGEVGVQSARPDLVPTTSEERADTGGNSPPEGHHHPKRSSVRRLNFEEPRKKSLTLTRQDATIDAELPPGGKEKKVERLFASTLPESSEFKCACGSKREDKIYASGTAKTSTSGDDRQRLTSNESYEETAETVSTRHVQIGEMVSPT